MIRKKTQKPKSNTVVDFKKYKADNYCGIFSVFCQLFDRKMSVGSLILIIVGVFCFSLVSWCEDVDFSENFAPGEKHEHEFGRSVILVEFDQENSTASINLETLEAIFLHQEVKDRRIVVVTIVGALRKGKSFFLDYCLRYMYANVRII